MTAPQDLQLEEWHPHVQAALRDWRDPMGAENSPLIRLQLVRQKLSAVHEQQPMVHRLVLNEVLQEQLSQLRQQDTEQADLLIRRYLDNESVLAVADALYLDKDSFLRRQRKAVRGLTACLLRAEEQTRDRHARQMEAGLYPPTYYQLFGVDHVLEDLVRRMLSADGAPVLALVGLGGIGKTALADAAARQLIRRFRFEQVVWLRVGGFSAGFEWAGKNNQTPAELTAESLMAWLAPRVVPHMSTTLPPRQRNAQVREVLKVMPSLIIIDNLELPGSGADWAAILPDLASPSRFLLTSRTRITEQAGIYHFPVRELSLEHARELIRAYGEHIGLADMTAADAAQVRRVYEVVGGNPLALKLVVSLAAVRPLPDILADLRQGYSPKSGSLYQDIYRQAWQSLSDPAQELLEIMPMAGDSGMAPEQMQRLSGLSDTAFWPAIDELAQRSLLEVMSPAGEVQERRYTIHRLTETFLHTSIIGWAGDRL